ncbi:MAG: ZIP family metal transporter [Candidatus Bathyarchaeota archaeon]|jgi:zinc and cadmium transporter|nr:ZIP family metal transporter [Candidatus Bathyarchaeota archaeon]
MNEVVEIFASVTVVSLISFIGIVFIGLKEELLKRILMVLVGFSSGTLLGSAFLDLLPEALAGEGLESSTVFLYVLFGIVVFFAIEKFLYWRHCHEGECEVHMFAYLNLIGDGVHNFIDGMIIAATFLISSGLGFATTLAVIFHEIPQEIGDFGVQIYGGLSKRRALMYNFISALTAVVGATVVLSMKYIQSAEIYIVPFAAGGFVYIAATDLMPELHKKTKAAESVIQFTSILFGMGLMAYLALVMGA